MSSQVLFLLSQCSLSTKEVIKNAIIWTQPLEVIARFVDRTRQSRSNIQFINFDIDCLRVLGKATFDESAKKTLSVDDFKNKLDQIYLYICQLFQTKLDLFVQLSSLEEYKIFVPHSIEKCVMYDETNREIGWKKLDELFEYQHNTCQPL
ncbi:unnamed protein product [Caenorhabditis brenneri]